MISPLYGQLSPLRIPTRAPRELSDTDAITYITSVETADGQSLEDAVKFAFEDFILGCKADGIWSAIKASCVLSGARTLAGALVPLVGNAPTNNNFVSGDYDRRTGLKGDGSTKWLNSNRNNNLEPQNSKHLAVFVSSNPTTSVNTFGCIATAASTGSSNLSHNSITKIARINASSSLQVSGGASINFFGASRNDASNFLSRANRATTSNSSTSATPFSRDYAIFASKTSTSANLFSNGRFQYYSIGESLDLALLDTRVSTLMTDLTAAIP